MPVATVSTRAIRADLGEGEKRPAWAALGRALGEDAARLIDEGADLCRIENDIIDHACTVDLGGNFLRRLVVKWDPVARLLTVGDMLTDEREVLWDGGAS
jgi:hypothetical protein